jgi:hypothetical protein
VLERHVDVLDQRFVGGDGVEQFLGDAVGIAVEEADPLFVRSRSGEAFEEHGEAVLEAEVLAVAGGVLADEVDFADAFGEEAVASLMTDSKRRLRKAPRYWGMTQKVQG